MKKNWFNNEVFFRLLGSYCVVLAVPILIAWFAYSQSIRMAEDYTKESNISMLKQSGRMVEKYFEEMRSAVARLAMHPKLNGILASKTTDNLVMMQFLKEADAHIVTNNFLTRFTQWSIYLRNSDYVIFSDTLYRSDFFYEHVFHYRDVSYDKWQRTLFGKFYKGEFIPAQPTETEQVGGSTITYLQSVPLGFDRSQADGVIAVLINENEFCQLLPTNIIKDGGWIYVIDERNRVVAGLADQTTKPVPMSFHGPEGFQAASISGQKMFITYTTSNNGWKYVAALPESVVMAKVHRLEVVVWSVTIVSLLAGIIAACVLAQKNAAPIRRIIRMVADFFGVDKTQGIGNYEFLQGRISEMIRDSQTARLAKERQVPWATATFFDHLFKGEFKSSEEIEIFASYIQLKIKGSRFRVVALRMYGAADVVNEGILKELDMTKYIMKETIKSLLGDHVLIHEVDENQIALVLGFEAGAEDIDTCTAATIDRIYSESLERYQIKLFFAVGDVSESLLSLSQSYDQAMIAANYLTMKGETQKVVWYREIPGQTDEYDYSLENETRLMNFTKAGDPEEVERLLNRLYLENMQKRNLSPEMMKQFLHEIIGTLIKLKNQVDRAYSVKERLAELDSQAPVETMYQQITQIFLALSRGIDDQKRSHNVNQKNNIIRYIQNSFTDPSLSLSSVAVKFGLTESYLSQFFKEQTGENFSVFLERIRMNRAEALLTESNLTIHEIATKVGYWGDQVFRRAFKRVMNISPNDYREQFKRPCEHNKSDSV